MVFSSPLFIFLFLPTVLTVYFSLRKELRNLVLLLSSILFYSWGEPKYVIVMIVSILMNYSFGILLDKLSYRKSILTLSIISNLSLLIFFKYYNFIIQNINGICEMLGLSQNISYQDIHLPIGISFFTFQALSYVVDVYRKETKVQKNFFSLALYISIFPQLIAGPIVRYHDIAKEIDERSHSINKISVGIKRFIIGLGKKIIIANNVGLIADKVFLQNPGVRH